MTNHVSAHDQHFCDRCGSRASELMPSISNVAFHEDLVGLDKFLSQMAKKHVQGWIRLFPLTDVKTTTGELLDDRHVCDHCLLTDWAKAGYKKYAA